MGEGGYINLVNGTPYRWKRTGQASYQMDAWNFPESINAGEFHPHQSIMDINI
jgi:hypothetical protein